MADLASPAVLAAVKPLTPPLLQSVLVSHTPQVIALLK